MRLDRRHAVVTGGGGAIGRAIAARLAAAGAAVLLADRDGEAAERAASAIPGAAALALDVTDEEACAALPAEAARRIGGFDALVHAAGIGIERAFVDTTRTEWERMLAVNLTGAFLVCREAARAMTAGGAIVTVASTAGERGSARRAAYAAAKAGLISLTQTMAVELAPRGIRANAISPGPIDTELTRRMHTAETRAGFARRTPLARYGRPEEIAGAALYLLSDEASYVTGHILHVDGGFLGAGVMT